MRTIQLVGALKPRTVPRLASKCAWCGKWASREDYLLAYQKGAKVSHGICDSCAKKFQEQLDAMPTPPAA